MRRLWSGALFALALAVQALAPAAAHVSMARGADSVDARPTLCLPALGDFLTGRNPSPDHREAGGVCPLCQVCCGGVAPVEAQSAPAGAEPVQRSVIAWTAADRALPTYGRHVAHQARAPPNFS